MKLQYTPDPAGHAWQLTAEGLPMNIHERSDFWRAIWMMESIAR